MLFRKRERFERTDVWQYDPRYNFVAIGVLVIVFVGFIILLVSLWGKANQPTRIKDSRLSTAVEGQSGARAPEGYNFSSDKFTNVLLLTVDDPAAASPVLQKADILTLDATTRTGAAANIPLAVTVTVGDAPITRAGLCATQGASACVAPLATAANLRMTHVVVASDNVWSRIAELKGAGLSSILGSSSEIFSLINTDMGVGDLMDLAELIQSIGVNNVRRFDAPTTTEGGEEAKEEESDEESEEDSEEKAQSGPERLVLDKVQLGADLGLLVAAG